MSDKTTPLKPRKTWRDFFGRPFKAYPEGGIIAATPFDTVFDLEMRVRGWGRLTGSAQKDHQSKEEAARIQDDLLQWICDSMNACAEMDDPMKEVTRLQVLAAQALGEGWSVQAPSEPGHYWFFGDVEFGSMGANYTGVHGPEMRMHLVQIQGNTSMAVVDGRFMSTQPFDAKNQRAGYIGVWRRARLPDVPDLTKFKLPHFKGEMKIKKP